MSTFLLCPPDHFDVSYRINPWMDPEAWKRDAAAYAERARDQWSGLQATLLKTGARVELMRPVAGLPDMVFTANGGLVLDRIALLPNFRHAERQGETPHFAALFESLKARGLIDAVRSLPSSIAFEGAGDCLWDPTRGRFWMGYGQRSQAEAAAVVSAVFNKPVIAVELVDGRYYHLDTCLRPMEHGHILYHPRAFSAESQRVIKETAGEEYLIPVDDDDAAHFACNAVTFGNQVVLSSASPALRKQLTQAGYAVHETPLDAFHKSGGSALCLTLRLDQNSVAAAIKQTAA